MDSSLDDIIKSQQKAKPKRSAPAQTKKNVVVKTVQRSEGGGRGTGGRASRGRGGGGRASRGRGRGSYGGAPMVRTSVRAAPYAKPARRSDNEWKQNASEDDYEAPAKPMMSAAARAAAAPLNATPKLLITNLGEDVTTEDMKELFADFGTLKSASVFCDETGKSVGQASVEFTEKAAAQKALLKYNGVPLDNKCMSIAFVAQQAKAAPLKQEVIRPRVSQPFKEAFREQAQYAPRSFSGHDDRRSSGGGGGYQGRNSGYQGRNSGGGGYQAPQRSNSFGRARSQSGGGLPRRGGGGGGGRGGGRGGGGRGGGSSKPDVDLEKQLEKYQSLRKSDE